MNTQPQTPGSQSAYTVVMIVGSTLMLIALGGSLALYFWGHQPYQGGEQWNDVIASIFIVLIGLPAFFIGLLLLLIGWFKKVRGKAQENQ
jgi:hypothetical protein